MTKISRLWGILGSLLVGVGLAQPANAANPQRAATTYPIRAIQVTPARVYQTKRQTGVGYHLTVLPGQRAQLRVNLHLKYHPQTKWTRTEQADIYRHGQRQRYYYVHNAAHQSGWVAAADLKPVPTDTVQLKVLLINQLPELPTGCEMTAATMLLQYAGVRIDKLALAALVPRSSNPNTGFVGDPTSEYGVGLYIYPQGLLPTMRRFLPTAVDLSGVSLLTIKQRLADRHPVVVWVKGLDGFASHTITLTGYTATTIRYNDPWNGQRGELNNPVFEAMWQGNGRRSLSY